MKVIRENLIFALVVAIETREADEKRRGYTGDSAGLAGWREVLRALQGGEQITIRD